MSSSVPFATVVVAYDYTYEKTNGTQISIVKNQVFHLVDRTNDSWWRVKPTPELMAADPTKFPVKGFYVPAKYVRVVEGGDVGTVDKRACTPTPDAALVSEDTKEADRPTSPTCQMTEESLNDALKKINLNKVEHGSEKRDDGAIGGVGGVGASPILSFADKKKNFESMLRASSKRDAQAPLSASASSAAQFSHAQTSPALRRRNGGFEEDLGSRSVDLADAATSMEAAEAEGGSLVESGEKGFDDREEGRKLTVEEANAGEDDIKGKDDVSGLVKEGEVSESGLKNEIDRYMDAAKDGAGGDGCSVAAKAASFAAAISSASASKTSGVATATTSIMAMWTQKASSTPGASPAAALVKSKLDAIDDQNKIDDRRKVDVGDEKATNTTSTTTSNGASETSMSSSAVIQTTATATAAADMTRATTLTPTTANASSQPVVCSVASLASTFEDRLKFNAVPVATTKADPPQQKTPPTVKKLSTGVCDDTRVGAPNDGTEVAPSKAERQPTETVDAMSKSFINPLFKPTQQQSQPPSEQREQAAPLEDEPVKRRPTRRAPPVHAAPPVYPASSDAVTTSAPPSFNAVAEEIMKMHRRSCVPDPGAAKTVERKELVGHGGGEKEKLGKRKSADGISSNESSRKEAPLSSFKPVVKANENGGKSQFLGCDSMEEIEYSPGWSKVYDQKSNSDTYLHAESGVRWFAGLSPDGKTYFYSEDRHVSAWTLPVDPMPTPPSKPEITITTTAATPERKDAVQRLQFSSPCSSVEELLDEEEEEGECDHLTSVEEDEGAVSRSNSINNDGNNNDVIYYKGWLNYAKLQFESSSKKAVKKNWNKGYVMLVAQWLVFYANAKRSKPLPNHPFGKPEFKVKISGASVTDGREKTKKSFAVLVSINDKDGAVLLQSDDSSAMDKWRAQLQKAAVSLVGGASPSAFAFAAPSPYSSNPVSPATADADCTAFPYSTQTPTMTDLQKNLQISLSTVKEQQEHQQGLSPPPPPFVKSSFKDQEVPTSRRSIFRRTKRSGSGNSESATALPEGGAWLDSWFKRRPSIHDVRERGIVKAGNIFGADLDELVDSDAAKMMTMTKLKGKAGMQHLVPAFVSKCVYALESRGLLSTDGLYRINGNCAEIQKLRFLVDAEKPIDLTDKRWDVHVLSGSLKLFFRELAHPLIPWVAFLATTEILKVSGSGENKVSAAKTKKILDEKMSGASLSTLRFLLSHLIKVANLSAVNRMLASNLGIVFGPTLMWSEAEMIAPGNMAFNMTFQSKLVEFMLSNFTHIFN